MCIRPSRRASGKPFSLFGAAATATILMGMISPAHAQTKTWTGGTDALWDTATNWSLSNEPTATEDALFPTPVPATGSVITLTAGELAKSLTFRDSYTFNGGDLTLAAPGNITVAPTFTATINSALIGTNGLTLAASNGLAGGDLQAGGGTLVLGGTNLFSGAVNVNAGTLRYSVDANLGAAANVVTLNGGTLQTTAAVTTTTRVITVGAAGGTIDLTGQYFANAANRLTGSGALTVTGVAGSNLRLAATNTYSGAMTIQNGGNVELGIAGAVATNVPFTLNAGGELDIQGGTGAFTLPATNSIAANGGTLSFENGTTGGVSAPITVNAGGLTVGLRDWYNLATVRSGTINGLISGSGPIGVNSGTGANGLLILGNAANTFSGTTTVTNSVLRAADGTSLPTASPLVLAGGLFETTTATSFNRSLGTGAGQVSLPSGAAGFSANGVAGTVNIGGAGDTLIWGGANFNPSALVLNAPSANNTLTLVNPIDLAGTTRTIAGNGPVANPGIISGAITSTGGAVALTVGNGATTGVVQLTNTGNTGINSVTLTSGTLGISAEGNIGATTTPITFNGGTLQITGTAITNAGAHPFTFNPNVAIGFDIATAANTFTVTNGFTAGQTLNKAGAGTLLLTPAASPNIVTRLNLTGGVLDLGNSILQVNNAGSSTIQVPSGTGTINATGTGGIVLTANDGDAGAANGSTLTINAPISGAFRYESFFANNGTGVTVLANPNNSFTGGLLISSGVVSVSTIGNSGANSPIGTGTTISFGNGTTTTGAFRYTGTGETNNRQFALLGTTAGATIDNSGTGPLVFTGNVTATGAGLKTLTLTGSTAGIAEMAGVIADNTSAANRTNVQKTGTGTWRLTGTNTYTGETIVTGGILNVASVSDYGVPSAIGARTAAQEADGVGGVNFIGLHLQGGTLQYTGATPQSTNRQLRMLGNTTGPGGVTNTIDASGSVPSATLSFTYSGANTNLYESAGFRTLQLTGTNTGANTFALRLTDQAATTGLTSLTKNGTGKWVLTNPLSTFTGGVNIAQGALFITSAGALGTGAKTITLSNGTAGNPQLHLDGSAGNIVLPNTFTYSTSNNSSGTTGVFINEAGDNTIQGTISPTSGGGDTPFVVNAGTLTVSAAISTPATGLGTRSVRLRGVANGTLSGAITNGSSLIGVVQEGTGTWAITGNSNTFSGGVAVTSGTLLANNTSGSATGTSLVSVSASGTLGGTGTISGAVSVDRGGNLAPGAGLGTLTIGSAVTFSATGTGNNPRLTIELKPSNLAAPSDLLSLTGAGALGALSLANPDVLNLQALEAIGTAQTFTIATFASESGVFDSILVNGAPSQNTDQFAANFVNVTYNPTNIQVTVANLAAVPEPATAGLLVAGGLGLLFRRRRA